MNTSSVNFETHIILFVTNVLHINGVLTETRKRRYLQESEERGGEGTERGKRRKGRREGGERDEKREKNEDGKGERGRRRGEKEGGI